MYFPVDANLPPWLARRLSEMGHAAEHVSDCLALDARDQEIISLAATGMV